MASDARGEGRTSSASCARGRRRIARPGLPFNAWLADVLETIKSLFRPIAKTLEATGAARPLHPAFFAWGQGLSPETSPLIEARVGSTVLREADLIERIPALEEWDVAFSDRSASESSAHSSTSIPAHRPSRAIAPSSASWALVRLARSR